MTEINWANHTNGGRVVDVSFESPNAASSADNLLRSRESQLWLAGPAPQHVTLSLSPRHPTLEYAGWHVWHDAATNPKVVEIASGPSLEQLRPLLVCEALTGAGTQVWRLPRPVPAEHRYVRFTIQQTFGPGPASMNTLVLLEKDPGPSYNASGEAASTTSVATSRKGSGSLDADYVAATPYTSRFGQNTSPPPFAAGTAVSEDEQSPPPRSNTRSSGPPPPQQQPEGINTSATSHQGADRQDGRHIADDGERSDVGVYITTRSHAAAHSRAAERGRMAQASSPRVRSSSRMSQLLRDLDEDIKLLKPIKSVNTGKNMLMYLPQDLSGLEMESIEDHLTPDREHHRRGEGNSGGGGGAGGGSPSYSGSDYVDGNSASHRNRHGDQRDHHRPQETQPQQMPHHSSTHRGDVDGRSGGLPHHPHHRGSSVTSGGNGAGGFADPNAMYPRGQPDTMALYPTSALPAGAFVNANYEARLSALEQAVAALNEAVQHQRDDLTMIKRLLLQQATERRKEAEQRYEEKQRLDKMSSSAHAMVTLPPAAAAAAAVAPAAPPGGAGGFLGDPRLTHRSITVDFPEDALRVFVESVLDQRLRKHNKKLEAKLLQRLDKQLHDVIKVLSATVEGQLANVATAAAAASAGQSLSTPRSIFTEHVSASNAGHRIFSPASQSSYVAGASSHNDVGRDPAHATPHRSGFSSPASSKADLAYTPRSQTEKAADAIPRVKGVSGSRRAV